MKYAVEMGSGAMIYTPSFIKGWFSIPKLMGWGDTQKNYLISLLLFIFQNKESMLKKGTTRSN
jgi:hypothetical protein